MRPIVKPCQGSIVYLADDSMAIISVRAWDGVNSAVLGKTVVRRVRIHARRPIDNRVHGTGFGQPVFRSWFAFACVGCVTASNRLSAIPK